MKPKKLWKQAWQERNFRIQLIASLSVLLLIALLIPHFFIFIQARNGYVLNDPVLQLLVHRDFSLLTFTLIYSAVITAIISFSFYPMLLLRGIQAYCLLLIVRVFCIWLVPLNDPSGMIILNDPFVGYIGYRGAPISKDLFFSGHTSTLFLFFLAAPNRGLKSFFFIITLIVASCILIQHVHYTIDVIAAPFFSWFCYRICFSKNAARY
jgi:hypothetical protein